MKNQRVQLLDAANEVKKLARIINDDDPALGDELDLLALKMEKVGPGLATPSTADFDISGNELKFPKLDSQEASLLERIIDKKDLLPASFLETGADIQRGVARIVLKKPHVGLPAGNGWGTGFLVSPTLLMTNNHVLEDSAMAKKVRIQFNYQLGSDGLDKTTDIYETAPEEFFQTNADLDYTIVRIKEKNFNNHSELGSGRFPPGRLWGYIELNHSPHYRSDQKCNIIQHPAGRRKEIAIHKNHVSKLFQNVIRYTSDTEPGSSGSPVFDNMWQLIALHHAGGERNTNGKWLNNEGIRIDKIIENLVQKYAQDSPEIIRELGI